MTNKRKNLISIILMLVGIAAGTAVGLLWENASIFEPIGTLYTNLLMCAAVPLVFFSISSTVGNMSSAKKSRKTIVTTVVTFFVCSTIAALISFGFFQIFPITPFQIEMEPSDAEATTLNIFSLMEGFFSQSDFLSLFSAKAMLPMIVAAIIFGFAIQKCGGAESPVAKLFTNLYECMIKTVQIITYIMPIGLFGIFASLSVKYGSLLIMEYLKLVATIAVLLFVYLFIAAPLYTFFAAGKAGVRIMWKHIWNIIPVAFGTMSSVATVPTNIEQATDSGIPDDISSIVIPLGANMNMHGSAMAIVARSLFLFAFFGRTITIGETVFLVLTIVCISMITPGIQGGSKILGPILIGVLFPDHFGLAMALISPITKMLDPVITTVNATMDYILSFVVTRLVEGKNWLKKDNVSD